MTAQHPVTRVVETTRTDVAVDLYGDTHGGGPDDPVLLVHGFPQGRGMWRDVAARLAETRPVVAADLPGYGDSGVPASDDDHLAYSKRALAADLVSAMSALGHERFAVVGHDRGGRVAYRTALDHPERVTALAVLDVVPIDVAWDLADADLALGFWPWSLLAQDAPLPERLVGADPDAVLDVALGPAWGTDAAAFDAEQRQAWRRTLADPDRLHAICEEYRAAAGVDREHDRADRTAGRRISAPTLVLWSDGGPLDVWYEQHGGPLEIWRQLADTYGRVSGRAVPGGHFFPEAEPALTAELLEAHLRLSGA